MAEDSVKDSVALRLFLERIMYIRADIRTETKDTLILRMCGRGLDLDYSARQRRAKGQK